MYFPTDSLHVSVVLVKYRDLSSTTKMFRYILAFVVVVLGVLFIQDLHLVAWHSVKKYVPVVEWASCAFNSNELKAETRTKADKLVFSAEDLKKYTNMKNGLYLAILGEVFDVSKGSKYYAPGEGYHFFTGRDGSRAFITGDFSEEGLHDNVLDLSFQDLSGLSDWLTFYQRDYLHKGVLIGRYYDSKGNPTEYKLKVEEKLRKAKEQQTEEDQEQLLLPPCNVEWNPETGSRVWCSNMSGGIKRKWIGVPRQLYSPGSDSFRCACVNLESEAKHMKTLKQYPNCDPQSSSCHVGKM